jgi:hypothetical protein
MGIYTEDEHQQQMINLLSERTAALLFQIQRFGKS